MPAAARPLPHINLTVRGAASAAFGSVVASARHQAVALGVEFSLLDACADLDRFHHTRQRLQAAGVRVVIDRITARAVPFLRLGSLQADLFKLEWSSQLGALDASAAASLAGALAPLDSSRLALQGADTEAALVWGLGRGIRRFQGRHVDAMLAAERMLACPHASGCSLGQCSERASATGDAGRVGCRNLQLLDAGTRPRARQTAA